MTAEGAESSDEEGGSSAKKFKTTQPPVPETPTVAPISSVQLAPMLGSPFMGMGPMAHYLGHLPMMGAMPQMPMPSGQVSSPHAAPKPLFPSASGSSTPSNSSISKPAFAAYRYMLGSFKHLKYEANCYF